MDERCLVRLAALAAFSPLALAACSGASAQLVETPLEDGGASTSSAGNSGTSSGTTPSGSGSGGSSSPGQGSTGNGNGNGQGGNGFDAGVAPTQCPPGGTVQMSGSGDSPSDPTPFDTVACGTLAGGQSYFWTFRLPASTSTFGISFTGGIQIQLTLDGTTVDVVPGATLPFRTKDPYYLQITPSGSSAQSYVLVVTEK